MPTPLKQQADDSSEPTAEEKQAWCLTQASKAIIVGEVDSAVEQLYHWLELSRNQDAHAWTEHAKQLLDAVAAVLDASVASGEG